MKQDKQEIYDVLVEAIGEEGCCVSCTPDVIFRDEKGWQLFLEGFMEPWFLGETVDEAKKQIREYAAQGFGLA